MSRTISHRARTRHAPLAQLQAIPDPDASNTRRLVARPLLQSAVVSSGMILASCQEAGTASTRDLDGRPSEGNRLGHAIRDRALEAQILALARKTGIGVSCSADRQILGKITADGLFLEQLETDLACLLPEGLPDYLRQDPVYYAGPAANLARDSIRKVDVLDDPELGMEAVWKIEVEDFPAFVIVVDKGNDFFASIDKTPETDSGK